MSVFERKPIFLDEETVAEQLRRSRQAKNLNVKEVSRRLNINIRYLEALEKNQHGVLPSGVYGRNFLKEYALFLGLDYKPLLQHFESEQGLIKANNKGVFERRVVSRRHLLALPTLLRNAIIGFLIIACLGYLGLLVKGIFEPPTLHIGYPPENLITADPRLLIKGQSEPETAIRINGQPVLADNKGSFEREIYLQPGLNVLLITAKKKYSRTIEVSRQVLVEQKQ